MAQKTGGALAAAAAEFEEDLARYRALSEELGKNEMGSQKALARAKTTLQDSVACEERMQTRLSALALAMNAAREEQLAVATATLDGAKRLQARHEQLEAMQAHFATLAERVHTIQEPLRAAFGEDGTQDPSAVLKQLHDVIALMESIIEEAQTMTKEAQDSGWEDVVRDVTSLCQQVQSARNKALLVVRKIAPAAPS